MPEILQILRYEYVPDIVERRAEHRPAHIEMIQAFHADSRLVMAGAVGDPPHSGLLVFRSADDAKAFAADDPYRKGGLVTHWTVEPWNIVT